MLQVEGIGIDEESLAYLGEIGERTSLRHAVQVRLLAVSTLQLWVSCLPPPDTLWPQGAA